MNLLSLLLWVHKSSPLHYFVLTTWIHWLLFALVIHTHKLYSVVLIDL